MPRITDELLDKWYAGRCVLDNHPVGVPGGAIAAHSLFRNNRADAQGRNLDRGTTHLADPLLESRFRLRRGGPAIDAGTATFAWPGKLVLSVPRGDFRGDVPDSRAFESDPAAR